MVHHIKKCKHVYHEPHFQKEEHHDRGSYISIIDEENMMKKSSLIGGVLGHPVAIDVKGGENVGRARILPSMKKGETVGQGCH